jgi:hypothetical protein
MRHIPEDELHAYLDQGLSRTQCVEIESHLAACFACQTQRDQIAALRDRTTALLARLAPPTALPPSLDALRRRAAEEASQHRRRVHVGAWAASLVAAVMVGWTASSVVGLRTAAPSQVAQAPAPRAVAAPAEAAPEREPKPVSPKPEPAASAARQSKAPARRERVVQDSIRAAMLAVLDPAPAVELTQLDSSPSRGVAEFDGMWRTVSWDGARAEVGERLPHIDGLPVLKVQLQAGGEGNRSVMVVAQQLSSGQVIQTIEGPAADVSQLLARRSMTEVDSVVLGGDSSARTSTGGHAMAMQRGDRMLAITGELPSDSLRAMIRRLNAEMRSK